MKRDDTRSKGHCQSRCDMIYGKHLEKEAFNVKKYIAPSIDIMEFAGNVVTNSGAGWEEEEGFG